MNLCYEILPHDDTYKLVRHRGEWHIDVVCYGTYDSCKSVMELIQ